MDRPVRFVLATAALVLAVPGLALAQPSATGVETPAPAEAETAEPEPEAEPDHEGEGEGDATAAAVPADGVEASHEPQITATFGGYVEANYTYSLSQPSNGVIALRAFDNQHNTFTLANVALFARVDYDRVYANIGVQWGNTPTTYYLAETARAPMGGIGPSDASTWRWLQVAYAGWSIPIDSMTFRLEGGLFLSPIGFEAMQVAQNWNFSRSNLFFGCPFYHSGIRAELDVTSEIAVTAAVWNGWNTLLDNNDEKSFSVAIDYSGTGVAAHFLYFSGIERNPGYAGGRAWRHLFDAYVRGDVTSWLSLALHATAGLEPSSIGTDSWEAAAAYVHVVPIDWMAITLRGDVFREDAPNDSTGARQAIFWPTEWMSSGTATVSFTPISALTFYLEYRHDHAAGNSFFAGTVALDATMQPIVNSDHQDTLTIGVSANVSGIEVGNR